MFEKRRVVYYDRIYIDILQTNNHTFCEAFHDRECYCIFITFGISLLHQDNNQEALHHSYNIGQFVLNELDKLKP